MSDRPTAEREQQAREWSRSTPQQVAKHLLQEVFAELDAVRAERNAWRALARHVLHCETCANSEEPESKDASQVTLKSYCADLIAELDAVRRERDAEWSQRIAALKLADDTRAERDELIAASREARPIPPHIPGRGDG